MKKIFLSIALGAISCGLFAQNTAAASNEDAGRWSLGLKGGIDFYRVTPDGNKLSWAVPTLLVEYSITPLFGMGFEAGYFNYDRSSGRLGTFNGSTIDAVIYGSMNISNLISPMRTGFWERVNLYSTTGFGIGVYNYDLKYNTRSYGLDKNSTGNLTGVAAFGMELAFNLGNSWEAALGGQYRYYTKPNLGGEDNAGFGSDALNLTLGVRYKFGAGSGRHTRSMTTAEYFPMGNNVTNINVDAQTLRRLRVLEDESLRAKVRQLENDLRALEGRADGVVRASFHNVEFDFNSFNLTQDGKDALDQIIRVLKNNTSWNRLKVTGFTDNIGTKQVNQSISESRANTVKQYLVANGIPAAKISTAGQGQDNPVATNRTEEGRQLNRRVEFEISR